LLCIRRLVELDGNALKYETPDVSGLDAAKYLTLQELQVLAPDMPMDNPEWERCTLAHYEKAVAESDVD